MIFRSWLPAIANNALMTLAGLDLRGSRLVRHSLQPHAQGLGNVLADRHRPTGEIGHGPGHAEATDL